jgi:hypothetical protein
MLRAFQNFSTAEFRILNRGESDLSLARFHNHHCSYSSLVPVFRSERVVLTAWRSCYHHQPMSILWGTRHYTHAWAETNHWSRRCRVSLLSTSHIPWWRRNCRSFQWHPTSCWGQGKYTCDWTFTMFLSTFGIQSSWFKLYSLVRMLLLFVQANRRLLPRSPVGTYLWYNFCFILLIKMADSRTYSTYGSSSSHLRFIW